MKLLLAALMLTLTCNVSFAKRGGSSTVGNGNPASENCVKLGGKSQIVDSKDGQYGICNIEEWTLFRQMAARNLVKDHTCDSGMPCMANPASQNCGDVGGTTQIVDSPKGQYGICRVEEWALFRIINVLN